MHIIVWISKDKKHVFSREFIRNLNELQQAVELKIGIPRKLQVLMHHDGIKNLYLILNNQISKPIWECENTIELLLFVHGTSDEKIIDACDQYSLNSRLGQIVVRQSTRTTPLFSTEPKVNLTIKMLKNMIALDKQMNVDELYMISDNTGFPVVDFDYIVDYFLLRTRPMKKIPDVSFLLDKNPYALIVCKDELLLNQAINVVVHVSKVDCDVDCVDLVTTLPVPISKVTDAKSNIEITLGIPFNQQVLHINGKMLKNDEFLKSYVCHKRAYMQLEITLAVVTLNNRDVIDICQQKGIPVLKPVKIIGKDFQTILNYYHKTSEDTIYQIQQHLATQFGLPLESIVLFYCGKNVNQDHNLVDFHYNNDIFFDEEIILHMVVKQNQANNVETILSMIHILAAVTIALKGKDTVLCQLPIGKLVSIKDVKTHMEALYNIPREFQVLYKGNGDVMYDSEPVFNAFDFERNSCFTLYLTFQPTENDGIQKFCGSYDICPLNTICIELLTTKTSINIAQLDLKTILDLKTCIYLDSKEKRTLVQLQKLFFHKEELEDAEKLINLFIKHEGFLSSGTMTFTLVVLPPRKVTCAIDFSSLRIRLSNWSNGVLFVEMLENDSICDLVQRIENQYTLNSKPFEIINPISDNPFEDMNYKVTLLQDETYGKAFARGVLVFEIHEKGKSYLKRFPINSGLFGDQDISIDTFLDDASLFSYKKQGKKLILNQSLNEVSICGSTQADTVNSIVHVEVVKEKACILI